MPSTAVARVESVDRVREYMHAAISGADSMVALSAPGGVVVDLAESLAAAVDAGALVVVLTDVDAESVEVELKQLASVARGWGSITYAPVSLTVDHSHGVIAPYDLLSEGEGSAVVFSDDLIEWQVFGSFVGTNWQMGTELWTPDPTELPATFVNIRQAVIQTVLHAREKTPLVAAVDAVPVGDRAPGPSGADDGADDPAVGGFGPADADRVAADGSERERFVGRVVDVSQCLLSPVTADYPGENSLTVERARDGQRVSVGGVNAFIEDYEAHEITLFEADSPRSPV